MRVLIVCLTGLPAAEALGRIEGHPRTGLPLLVRELKSSNAEARQAAAETLGRLGPHAKTVMPALQEALKDSQPLLRRSAAEAIQKLTNPRGIEKSETGR